MCQTQLRRVRPPVPWMCPTAWVSHHCKSELQRWTECSHRVSIWLFTRQPATHRTWRTGRFDTASRYSVSRVDTGLLQLLRVSNTSGRLVPLSFPEGRPNLGAPSPQRLQRRVLNFFDRRLPSPGLRGCHLFHPTRDMLFLVSLLLTQSLNTFREKVANRTGASEAPQVPSWPGLPSSALARVIHARIRGWWSI